MSRGPRPGRCFGGLSSASLAGAHHFPPSFLQLVSEKVGGAEGTKLDDDFKEMEKVRGRCATWVLRHRWLVPPLPQP